MSLKTKLEDFLAGYEKLVILGIGNELRGDDALGSYFIKMFELDNDTQDIQDNQDNLTFLDKNVILINCGSVPENFTGLIKEEKPSHLIIIDAALMETPPGTIKVIDKEKIANINTSTHSMSLSFLIKYLEKDISFKFLFIGIEPLNMDFGEELSEEVLNTINSLYETFISLLNDL